ncbi:MAG: hypothetical protein QHJ73_14710, partial [Armatimonadota bacterium]|nr:hypothetical protein [Armatimonadota bacterium]
MPPLWRVARHGIPQVAATALLTLLTFCITPAEAATYVNRPGGGPVQDVVLNADTTWDVAGSPYILEAHFTVAAGVTLTIQNGVTVQVAQNRGFWVQGTLAATGATFTHYTGGYWLGMYLGPGAGASVLNGCTFSYGGAHNG